MADQKITQLTEVTAIASSDIFPVVVDPSTTAITRKISRANIFGQDLTTVSSPTFDTIIVDTINIGGVNFVTTDIKLQAVSSEAAIAYFKAQSGSAGFAVESSAGHWARLHAGGSFGAFYIDHLGKFSIGFGLEGSNAYDTTYSSTNLFMQFDDGVEKQCIQLRKPLFFNNPATINTNDVSLSWASAGTVSFGSEDSGANLDIWGNLSIGNKLELSGYLTRAFNLVSTVAVARILRTADDGASTMEFLSYDAAGTTQFGYWDMGVAPANGNNTYPGDYLFRDRIVGTSGYKFLLARESYNILFGGQPAQGERPQYGLSFVAANANSIGINRRAISAASGNNLTITAGGASILGQITNLSATPTNGGSNYAIGDILTITTGGGNAKACVYSVSAGAVTGVKLITQGSGYSTGTGQATSGGSGTGCTLNIAAVATATNKLGGTLILQGGVSTGTGTSEVIIQVYGGGTSGGVDNTPITIAQFQYNNINLGSTSTDTISCIGRLIVRSVASDPTANNTAGSLGEIVRFGDKYYGKTVASGIDKNWSALN